MNILYREHPNLRSLYFIKVVFKAFLGALLASAILVGLSFAGVYSQTLGILFAVLAVAIAITILLLVKKSIVYTISSSGIRVDSGILVRKRDEFGIRKIQSVDVKQNLIERFILKTGDVAFDSAAGDMQNAPDIAFKGVSNPNKVADIARNADDGAYGSSFDAYNQSRYTQQPGYPAGAPSGYPAATGYPQNPGAYPPNQGGSAYDRPPSPDYHPPGT